MSTIITKNSATSGSQPSSLIQGELAINVTDGRLFYGSGSGNIVREFTGSGGGGSSVTSSYALTASYVALSQTASYVQNAQTASYVLQAVSSSFSSTSSYVQNAQTASYVITAQTASYVQTSQTASYVLQAVSASYASTAEYVNGMKTKSNVVLNTSFGGTPLTAVVTFNTAFPDTDYSILVTGEDARAWTIESKTESGFTINTNSSIELIGSTFWQATSYGEFNS